MIRREVPFPSFLPGWALIGAALLAGVIGLHLAFTAFTHSAERHSGPMILHVASGESWRGATAVARCSLTVAFGGLSSRASRPRPDPWTSWCNNVYRLFDEWSRGPGSSWFGFVILFMTISGVGAYVSVLHRFVPRGPGRRRTTTFATRAELAEFAGRATERLPEGALPLGVAVHGEAKRTALWLPLTYRPQHVWILGVTGAGKTSATIKRWVAADVALDGSHGALAMSTVAVDVKDPDLWQFVAPLGMERRRRVLRWAPMANDSLGHNFLDYVVSPADALDLAEVILSNEPDSKGKDPFWRGLERNIAQMTILLLCTEPADVLSQPWLDRKLQDVLGTVPPPRSMPFLLGLTHLSAREFQDYVEKIDKARGERETWRNRFATAFQQHHDKLSGALQGIQNTLVSFRDPTVIAATIQSDFNLRAVVEQPTTLIIGLPREPGHQRQILTALFLRQLLAIVARTAAEHGNKLPVPLTMLLDELGALGYVPTLPDVIATYRDFGVSFVIATQDRAQLKDVYDEEKADILVANLRTRVVFGRDLRPEQADEICSAFGEVVVTEPQVTFEHRNPFRVRKSVSRVGYQLRRLLEPNELRAMREFEAAVVLPGDVKAHAYLPPVHTDPQFAGLGNRPIPPLLVFKHQFAMDRVLGRIAPPTRPATGQPDPRAISPSHLTLPRPATGQPGPTGGPLEAPPDLQPPRQDAPASGEQPLPRPAGEAALSAAPRSAEQAVGAEGDDQQTLAAAGSPAAMAPARQPALITAMTGNGERNGGAQAADTTGTGGGPAGGGSDAAAGAPSVAPFALSANAPLVDFLSAVVGGRLADERVKDGSRGWIVSDEGADLLVPWGLLKDWGYKTRQRFTDAEKQWRAQGLLGNRITNMVAGKAVTCLVFRKVTLDELPTELAARIRAEFNPVARGDLKLSGGTPKKPTGWGPDVPADPAAGPGAVQGRTATGTPPPPFLPEFIAAACARGAGFIDHPQYDPKSAFLGRWVFRPRDRNLLLLVERTAAVQMLASVGVIDPAVTLQIWCDAGVLYVDEDVRGEFYIRRRAADGSTIREFLALPWSVLLRWGLAADVKPTVV